VERPSILTPTTDIYDHALLTSLRSLFLTRSLTRTVTNTMATVTLKRTGDKVSDDQRAPSPIETERSYRLLQDAAHWVSSSETSPIVLIITYYGATMCYKPIALAYGRFVESRAFSDHRADDVSFVQVDRATCADVSAIDKKYVWNPGTRCIDPVQIDRRSRTLGGVPPPRWCCGLWQRERGRGGSRSCH
jgi:hypothetical protein